MKLKQIICALLAAVLLLTSAALADTGWTFTASNIKVDVGGKTVNLRPTAEIELAFSDDYQRAGLTLTVSAGKRRLDRLYMTWDAGSDTVRLWVAGGTAVAEIDDAALTDGLRSLLITDSFEEIDIALMIDEPPLTVGAWQARGEADYAVSLSELGRPVRLDLSWREADDPSLPTEPSRGAVRCADLDQAVAALRDDMKPSLHSLFADDTVWYLVRALAG